MPPESIMAVDMHLKDYYGILNIKSSATLADIKKAYRLLALQYHPDKNNNDFNAQIRFAEIKEAYEILTNPAKKEYYLQQRWYNQSLGKRKMQTEISPFGVLQQALDMERYVAGLDIFRMDSGGLKDYILELLSSDTIEKLKHFNDTTVNLEIVKAVLRASHPLPKSLMEEVMNRLRILAATSEQALQLIEKQQARHPESTTNNNTHYLSLSLLQPFFVCLFILPVVNLSLPYALCFCRRAY